MFAMRQSGQRRAFRQRRDTIKDRENGRMRITILALAFAALGCGAAVVTEAQDEADTVTLEQAMESVGTADVELFSHSVARAAPGIPPFDPDLPADVWDAVEADVRATRDVAHRRSLYRPRAAGWRRAHHRWAEPGRSDRLRGLIMKRHLLIGTLLAVSLACALSSQVPLTDLQGQALTGPRPIEALNALRVGGGSAPTPNQSLISQSKCRTRMAACIASVVQELSNYARVSPSAWQVPDNVLWKPIGWRIQHQHFDYRPVPGKDHNDGPYASVTFSKARWDPTYSKVNYGTKRIAQDVKVSDSAKTKVVQNDSDVSVLVTYTESEAITNAFSTTVTHGLTLDMTTSSETEVGGEYAGVSAKETLTLEFGVTTTDEETREESQEGTSEAAINIEFDAEPRQYYLVTITKEHATTYQPFSIDGVMDFDITIQMPGQ